MFCIRKLSEGITDNFEDHVKLCRDPKVHEKLTISEWDMWFLKKSHPECFEKKIVPTNDAFTKIRVELYLNKHRFQFL